MPNSILTERQKLILLCLGLEWSEPHIAELIGRSVSTVSAERECIYEVLGVHSAPGALFMAQKLGIITQADCIQAETCIGRKSC